MNFSVVRFFEWSFRAVIIRKANFTTKTNRRFTLRVLSFLRVPLNARLNERREQIGIFNDINDILIFFTTILTSGNFSHEHRKVLKPKSASSPKQRHPSHVDALSQQQISFMNFQLVSFFFLFFVFAH